jgi:predicted acyltransferase
MALMVVVNNPGDWNAVYAPLLHAPWHGWTPTDLVFPFFLFIVGVAATLSRRALDWRSAGRRALLIFAIGVALSGFPYYQMPTLRIPGVLQRIALCYLATAALLAWAGPARSLRAIGRLTAVAFALLAAHWIVLTTVPVGGVRGDLSPEGNVGAVIDRALLAGHLWKPGWDPEGLLGTVPATATALSGAIAGLGWRLLGSRYAATWLIVAGAGLAGSGLAAGEIHPINKSLWTASYVLFTSGVAWLLLGLLVWTIDVRGHHRWTQPFLVLGANALLLFVVSGVVGRLELVIPIGAGSARTTLGAWLHATTFERWAPPRLASLAFALAHLGALYGLLAALYRRRLFWRV